MLAFAFYQLLDGIFVGQFLGETAFAALNLAMPFVIINFALADLIGVGALQLFALTYVTRWLSFAAQSYMLAVGKALPASTISLSIALIFPVLFVVVFCPLGLTGLWLNFAGSSLMAGLLALFLLWQNRDDLNREDIPKFSS